MTDFFTSDNHFDHVKILEHCNRPFDTVEQMNLAMVERWNSVVSHNDTVYHLGDVTLGGIADFSYWTSLLNGNIRIIKGNHDKRWIKNFEETERISIIPHLTHYENRGINIILSHYPLLEWEGYYRGWWHLFAHTHCKVSGVGKSFDVGVDCHNFTPLSLDEVIEKMKEKE